MAPAPDGIIIQGFTQGHENYGLKAGDKLVITPLGQVSSGTQVNILGEDNKATKPQSMKQRPTAEQLAQQAKEQGISVAELVKTRRAAKQGDKP